MMKDLAMKAFAAWLSQNEPALFAALAERADRAGAATTSAAPLGDWSDILSSIGSGIADAASSVASYLSSSQGVSSLATLAKTYLGSQAQKNALQVQLAQAQAAKPPAPIQTQYNPATGAYEAVYTPPATTTGVVVAPVPLTPTLSAQLLSQTQSNWQQWLPWIIGGGAALALVIWLATRNQS